MCLSFELLGMRAPLARRFQSIKCVPDEEAADPTYTDWLLLASNEALGTVIPRSHVSCEYSMKEHLGNG